MALARNRSHAVSERREELEALFESWGSNDAGTLNPSELQHMMKFVFPPSTNDMFLTNLQHQQFLAEEMARVTRKMKIDEEIDFPTFEAMATLLEVSLRERQLKESFSFFDTKGDGLIDRDELHHGLAALEFPHRLNSKTAGHLKESKLEKMTERLMLLGDPANQAHIDFSSFAAVHDEIRAYQIKKQSKVDSMDHTL